MGNTPIERDQAYNEILLQLNALQLQLKSLSNLTVKMQVIEFKVTPQVPGNNPESPREISSEDEDHS